MLPDFSAINIHLASETPQRAQEIYQARPTVSQGLHHYCPLFFYLFAHPDDFLEVILRAESLDGGERLAAVALLDADVD